MKTQREDGVLGFSPLTFSTTRMAELSALRASRTLPAKETHWYSFPLEAEWAPELLNEVLDELNMMMPD
jgi:hypothetical protein